MSGCEDRQRQNRLEEVLDVVLSEWCHASDAFPASIGQTSFNALLAERCKKRG